MLKIVAINSRKDLLTFVKFNISLYKGNQYAVPPLIFDDMNTLLPSKNPASDFCQWQCFLCYKQGEVVGRITAFINQKANTVWGKTHGRFGFIDFAEDFEVAKLLIDTAIAWVKERGMTAIEGPLGFTDMDKEGMLIEGFDQLGTIATIYNYPYYSQYLERMGFTKAADWVEMKVFTPAKIPDRVEKVAKIVESRMGIRVLRLKNTKEVIKQGMGNQIFEITNNAYSKFFGYSELTQRQIDAYVKQYIPMVRMEFLTLIVDSNDKLIAYGLGLPSMSRAMQKARGRMFPFGFIYLLKALKAKKCKVVDFMLIAIHPDWQGKGVNAIIMREFYYSFVKSGTIYSESNPELELNTQIQNQWEDFEVQHHKRRRAYIKDI